MLMKSFFPSYSSSSPDGLSGGAIAGIVVGSVAFVVLVVLAVYFILKYRKQKKARRSQQVSPERGRDRQT